MRYLDYCISPDFTVRDALKVIDKTDAHIVFIASEGKPIASLTDGDIRRFLLAGGKIESPAMDAGHRSPLTAHSEEEAVSLYHQRNYVAIPILNTDNRIVDVYVGSRIYEGRIADLGIPVAINAGGKGTRLEPYTKILPKPLIPVGDLPIIEHIMQRFQEYGCNRFSIIVNYKKEIMKAYFADNDQRYDITWYDEEKPLGTGGGLCYLKGKVNQTFFFTNCDNLLLSDFEGMLKFHREQRNAITMVCAYKNIQIPYGVIEMGINGSIEAMKEKPELSFLTNTGIYIVEPEVLDDIEDNVPVGFPDIIDVERKMGRKVAIYPISGNEWMDMGQLSELEQMRKRLYGE